MGIKGCGKIFAHHQLTHWSDGRSNVVVVVNGRCDGHVNYPGALFFQIYLYMAPCEQCVYIRYAIL